MSVRGKKLIAEVRKAAAERPEHSVNQCVYYDFYANCPSCIIGVALFGVKIVDKDWARENNDTSLFGLLNEDGRDNPFRALSKKEIEWLDVVQMVQDGRHNVGTTGSTVEPGIYGYIDIANKKLDTRWSNAVRFADSFVGEL